MLTTDLLSQSSSKFKTEADGVPATALNAFSSSDPSFTSMHCVPQKPTWIYLDKQVQSPLTLQSLFPLLSAPLGLSLSVTLWSGLRTSPLLRHWWGRCLSLGVTEK